MTDTELILSRLDSMHADMKKMQGDISELREEMQASISELRGEMQASISELRGEMQDNISELRGEMQDNIAQLRTEMSDMRTELSGKIEEVRLMVVDLRDRVDTLEFALQTEIAKTYDLAQENARKLSRLICCKGKIIPIPVT